MEAPTGKVIVMIIAYILLVLIPSSEACSASKKEGKFLGFAQNNQKRIDGPKVLCLQVLT